jgi:glycosyltransferase involved in cell wall biosynthesis
MRVLLSAYACEPGGGSETGKGWRFARALADHGCDVVVLTCGSHHKAAIESYGDQHGIPPNLSFAWHDVPGWPGPGYVNARHIRRHYIAWQITARRTARRLIAERPFDVIHHLTWTVLRWPSFLGGLGPRFVFGPVGGGETSPRRLRASMPPSGRRTERLRDIINFASRFDPTVRNCLRHADVILVTDQATANHVPSRWRDKTSIVADILAPEILARTPPAQRLSDGPSLLFAGRLESWKAAHLAIGALADLRRTCPGARLTIVGSGPDEDFFRAQAQAFGVESATVFSGQVAHDRMTSLYASHDVFLFPSLHDSGPHVIGEALAHGLPVVCLDLGGPGVAIDETCGVAVSAKGAQAAEIHAKLASAIAEIAQDPARMISLRRGAYSRARQFTADARVADMVRRFYAAD